MISSCTFRYKKQVYFKIIAFFKGRKLPKASSRKAAQIKETKIH